MGLLLLIAGALVLILCITLLPVVLSALRKRRVLRNVPGMKEYPILGHAPYYIGKTPQEILEVVLRGFKECGKVWKLFLLHEAQVVVSDPKVLEVILSSQKIMRKSSEYSVVRNWLGDGLLLSTGKKWLGRRRAITPAFHFKILEEFVEVFDRNSNILVDIMGKNIPTDAVDIFPLITLAALDVICETSMGAKVDAQINSGSKYVQAVKDIATVLHLRMTNVSVRNDFLYSFSDLAKTEKKSLKVLHQFTDSVIVARRKELLEKLESSDSDDKDDVGMKKKMALLDILLQSTIDGNPLSNLDIREEVDTFMFEGHDTTTTSTSFALYLLAKHPEVQEKVLKEICDVIGEDKSTPFTQQKLNDLHYLDAVVKEVMRIFPPVPLIGRMIEEDLKINEYTFPAGTNLVMCIMYLHRDPEIYPEPEVFKPERFLEARSTDKVNAYSYIPFSAGSRNCIGQKFALLEMKTMMCRVIQNFELSVDPSYKKPLLIAELVLKPENGIVLNLKRRK